MYAQLTNEGSNCILLSAGINTVLELPGVYKSNAWDIILHILQEQSGFQFFMSPLKSDKFAAFFIT